MRIESSADFNLLQRLCSSLPDDPSAIGQLDPDTALSRGTWRAALAGVGACCHAIDSIMAGKVLALLLPLLKPRCTFNPRVLYTVAAFPRKEAMPLRRDFKFWLLTGCPS